MNAIQSLQGEFSRHLSLVAKMCIHFGVPVEAVLAELRQQLGAHIDARQGLSIAEASRLCDVSRKTISNWLKEARQQKDAGVIFSKIIFLGQVCDFCRQSPMTMQEIQGRAIESGWRYGSEARELRRILAELVEAGALVQDARGHYQTALEFDEDGYARWTPSDALESYRQKAALLELASAKTSPIHHSERLRTTLHFPVADLEAAVARVRGGLVNEMVRDLRSWSAGGNPVAGTPRTLGILIAVAPTIPPNLNSMLADQERMNLLNSACEATSPFPRSQRTNRVLYARFRDLRSGVRYLRERLLGVVEAEVSSSIDEEGEDWLGVVVAAAPIEVPNQGNES